MNKEAIVALMALMSENNEICLFEDDIYNQEVLDEEGIPARESILLMWLSVALVADGMKPKDVFDMGMTHYRGERSPYSCCELNWFNYPIKLNISICFDLLDAIKEWLKHPENFKTFEKYFNVAKELGITTDMVEDAANIDSQS